MPKSADTTPSKSTGSPTRKDAQDGRNALAKLLRPNLHASRTTRIVQTQTRGQR